MPAPDKWLQKYSTEVKPSTDTLPRDVQPRHKLGLRKAPGEQPARLDSAGWPWRVIHATTRIPVPAEFTATSHYLLPSSIGRPLPLTNYRRSPPSPHSRGAIDLQGESHHRTAAVELPEPLLP